MATFKPELEEYLQTINQGLLSLEKGLSDDKKSRILNELFRSAHNIKGTSRVVGLPNIGDLAHLMEDVMDAYLHNQVSPSENFYDVLFKTTDTLNEMMDAHMGQGEMPIDQINILTEKLKQILAGKSITLETSPVSTRENLIALTQKPEEISEPDKIPTARKHQIQDESIRVKTSRIDDLMDNMSELMVYQIKSNQQLQVLEHSQKVLYNWQKIWRKSIPSSNNLQINLRNSSQEYLKSRDLSTLAEFLAVNEELISSLQNQIDEQLPKFIIDNNRQAVLINELQNQVKQMRMVPFSTIFNTYPRTIRDLGKILKKEVVLEINGEDTEADRQIIASIKDSLIHLLRNAIAHGIENPEIRTAKGKSRQGTIQIQALQKGNTIEISIKDDGAGINLSEIGRIVIERKLLTKDEFNKLNVHEQLELIFAPNFSTKEVISNLSGRGVGLNIVRHSLEKLQGMVRVETRIDQGTTFTLILPSTLSTSHILPVSSGGRHLGIPVSNVEKVIQVKSDQFNSIEGNPIITFEGQPMPFFSLAQLLNLPEYNLALQSEKTTMVILGLAEKRIALIIDNFEEPFEVVIKDLGSQLIHVRNIYGGAILGDGQIMLILNVADLMRTAVGQKYMTSNLQSLPQEITQRKVLLVDDSIATRTIEKNILENAGYQVTIATDGVEAWELIQQNLIDVIVSDVNMPRMDGVELTEKVKNDDLFGLIPIILVTSLDKKEDRLRGLNAGADAYIAKGKFDQKELLETIERLVK